MYDLWNGIEGLEHQDHQQDSLHDTYDEVVDSHYSTINTVTGYQDGYFGNDPLSQSKLYQCPKFPGVTLVDSYVRADGTVVNAHWRTNPDGITSNNFSAK